MTFFKGPHHSLVTFIVRCGTQWQTRFPPQPQIFILSSKICILSWLATTSALTTRCTSQRCVHYLSNIRKCFSPCLHHYILTQERWGHRAWDRSEGKSKMPHIQSFSYIFHSCLSRQTCSTMSTSAFRWVVGRSVEMRTAAAGSHNNTNHRTRDEKQKTSKANRRPHNSTFNCVSDFIY